LHTEEIKFVSFIFSIINYKRYFELEFCLILNKKINSKKKYIVFIDLGGLKKDLKVSVKIFLKNKFFLFERIFFKGNFGNGKKRRFYD